MHKGASIALSILILFSLVNSPAQTSAQGCTADIDGKTDAELEQLLAACEAEIAVEQGKLGETQKEKTSIEADIQALNYKIRAAELEIGKRNIEISRLSGEIGNRSDTISALNEKSVRVRTSLAELIRENHESGSQSIVEALLSGEDVSSFFANVEDLTSVKGELGDTMLAIREIKADTEVEKGLLEDRREEERVVRYKQESEKQKTVGFKSEKDRLLALTEAEEAQYKQSIAERETIKNKIRNRLFKTVGGLELTFGEALALVRQVEDRVGINPALVMAVLTQESGVNGIIGKNIGRCTYNQSFNNSAGTVMSNSQKDAFLAITTELGLDADTVPVSCPIVTDGAFGGALGPAQFMPNTWWNPKTGTGYKKRVSKVTGVASPSPFEPLHAFTGTALYLRDALDRCLTAFSATYELRACSAAKYYSGLGSKGSRLSRHMNPTYSYGAKVARRAAEYEKDIALLDL